MLPVLLLLGAAGVVVDELVLWAGQPTGDPSSATVAGWYGDHAGRVLVGDLCWVLACGALAVGYLRTGLRLQAGNRRLFLVVGLAGVTALVAAALVAASLAMGERQDAASWWRGEGPAFRAGLLLAAASMLVLAVSAARTRTWVAVAAGLVLVLLLLPGTSLIGLAALFVVLALGAAGTATEGERRV